MEELKDLLNFYKTLLSEGKNEYKLHYWMFKRGNDGYFKFYNEHLTRSFPCFVIDEENKKISFSEYCPVISVAAVISEILPEYTFEGKIWDKLARNYVAIVKSEFVRDMQVFTGDFDDSVDLHAESAEEMWKDFKSDLYLGIVRAMSEHEALLKLKLRYPYFSEDVLELIKL